MDDRTKVRWYHSGWFVILALACLGPFAFPLLFKSRRFTLTWKVIISVVVTALTVWSILLMKDMYLLVMKQLEELKQLYGFM